MIPNPGKDCMNVSSYKAIITILNCDQKFFPKYLFKNRFFCCLPKFFNAYQNGFVKVRNIGNNIRLMLDIIDYKNSKKVSSGMLSVDLRKVFDLLKWPFIFKMLNFA